MVKIILKFQGLETMKRLVSLTGYRFTTGDLEACSPLPCLISMPLGVTVSHVVGHSAEETNSFKGSCTSN